MFDSPSISAFTFVYYSLWLLLLLGWICVFNHCSMEEVKATPPLCLLAILSCVCTPTILTSSPIKTKIGAPLNPAVVEQL